MDTDNINTPTEEMPGQLPLFDLSEVDELRAQVKAAAARNQQKYLALQRQGVIPDPNRVFLERLETLLDMALTEQDRLRFNLAFEQRMTKLLDQCLSETRQQQIVTPGRGAGPGLFVPGS